jgi:LDH2 family malate/lactate/ureidoglycolate dehydrogenase
VRPVFYLYGSGGYKGTGLCMMVEVFCGIMSGSAFGRNIRQWKTNDQPADLVFGTKTGDLFIS